MEGVGKLIITITMILILSSFITIFAYEYGPPSAAAELNSTIGRVNANFTKTVYNPLNSSITSGINASSNLQASSQNIGFALAFILPGFVSIMSSLLNLPILLNVFFGEMIGFLPNSGIQYMSIVGYLIDDLILFILLWAVQMWMKMPAW
ncbi:MAG: hypothetical protein ACP5L3_06535 [Caldisericum sp.]|uniref:hypothetical protein n=1 Tax=Caldisericum sp. TaxID=2499687 RepID=UPI003D0A3681